MSCDIICLGEFSERLRNGQSIEPMRCGLSSPDGVSLALSASAQRLYLSPLRFSLASLQSHPREMLLLGPSSSKSVAVVSILLK